MLLFLLLLLSGGAYEVGRNVKRISPALNPRDLKHSENLLD